VSAVVLDTHVLHWLSAEPNRLSDRAASAISAADELAVASVTWYELAWLARHRRIDPGRPVRSWLDGLSRGVRTLVITPVIAETAAGLPPPFPGDPADRLIYSTAVEHGLPLVTKDTRMRAHSPQRALW
jgi:PIN domain nuclease of toxin-antitoxin system